jgi:hypothetical protein
MWYRQQLQEVRAAHDLSLVLLDHDTDRRLGRASPFLQDFACSFENIYENLKIK